MIKIPHSEYVKIYNEHKERLHVFSCWTEPTAWFTAWGLEEDDEPLIDSRFQCPDLGVSCPSPEQIYEETKKEANWEYRKRGVE